MHFFLAANKLWRKDSQGQHRLVTTPSSRLVILRAAHDDVGHKGFYPMNALIALQFWWPCMRADIAWFVRTCWLSTATNATYPHSPYSRNPRTFVRKNLCRYDAYAEVRWLQVHRARTVFNFALCRISHASHRDCGHVRRLVI